MSSQRAIKSAVLVFFGMASLALALSGCSDIYYDRRETIAAHAGDAGAVNRVTHTIDPWSRASANNNFSYNGEKMQAAAERYRTGKIIQPVNAMTSTSYQQSQSPSSSSSSSSQSSASANNKP